ncbi:PAS domain-containing sensor histidine kinase [Rhodoflexus sp.]
MIQPEIHLLQELLEQSGQSVVLCNAAGEIRYANRQAKQLIGADCIASHRIQFADTPVLVIGERTLRLQERPLNSPDLRWFTILEESSSTGQLYKNPADEINNLLLQLSSGILSDVHNDQSIIKILESITLIGNYDAGVIYPKANSDWAQHTQLSFIRNKDVSPLPQLLSLSSAMLDSLINILGPRTRYLLRTDAHVPEELKPLQDIVRQSGFSLMIIVPIRSDQGVEGLLSLYSSGPFLLSQKKLDAVLVFFATTFANSIRNLRIKQQIDSYRELAEKQIVHTLNVLDSLLNNTPLVAIQAYDPQGIITYWNTHSKEIYGYSGQEVAGRHLSEFFVNSHATVEQLNKVLRTQQPSQPTEMLVKTKNGKKIWVISSMIPVLADNSVINVSSIYRLDVDITRLKEIEAQERITKNALQQYSLRIEQQNQDLLQKEEALIQANEVLKLHQYSLDNAIKELSERNYELDQFVHKVSHDIRSPLTSLLGLIDVMYMYLHSPEMLKECLENMVKSIKRLDRFVLSMLDYSRANRKEDYLEPIKIEAILEEALEDLKYMDNFQRMRITYHLPDEAQIFKSDPVRLVIILRNLISNAIKYANVYKNDNRLEISVQVTPEKAVFIIQDNGIGIKQELADKVFDMFFRATANAQGSGLGLYIVKQTVTRMGGTIDMQTEYGQGTTFTVILPNHA